MITDRLRLLMKKLNMNQKQFAAGIRMDPGRFSRVLSGKSSLSSRDCYLLQQAYGINLEWLNDGTGEMFDDFMAYKNASLDFSPLLMETIKSLGNLSDKELLAVISFINYIEENREKFN